jgi:hypothetical protein
MLISVAEPQHIISEKPEPYFNAAPSSALTAHGPYRLRLRSNIQHVGIVLKNTVIVISSLEILS